MLDETLTLPWSNNLKYDRALDLSIISSGVPPDSLCTVYQMDGSVVQHELPLPGQVIRLDVQIPRPDSIWPLESVIWGQTLHTQLWHSFRFLLIGVAIRPLKTLKWNPATIFFRNSWRSGFKAKSVKCKMFCKISARIFSLDSGPGIRIWNRELCKYIVLKSHAHCDSSRVRFIWQVWFGYCWAAQS